MSYILSLILYEQMRFTLNREHIMLVAQLSPTRAIPKFIIGKRIRHNWDVCKMHMCILRLPSPLYDKYPCVCYCARIKTAIRVLYNRMSRMQLTETTRNNRVSVFIFKSHHQLSHNIRHHLAEFKIPFFDCKNTNNDNLTIKLISSWFRIFI